MGQRLSRRGVLGGVAAAATVTGLRPGWAITMPTLCSAAAMRADIGLLQRAYDTLHPGLLRYQTAAGSARRFAMLTDACARPMPLARFYLHLSRLLAGVRCGHSYANFYNQSKTVRATICDAPGRLPLSFRWLGDRCIVTADPFATGIAPGSAVRTIDGRPAGAVLAALMQVARADGHNDARRRRLMSVQGDDGYESFDIFYPLLFGEQSRFRLEVVGLDGRRRRTEVAATTLAARRESRPQRADPRGSAPLWTIERRGDTALLTMPSWGVYDTKWDWRGWLDTVMDRLAADRVGRLVIDLRANEGGLDCGNALVARLIERPVPFDTARRLVRYARVPDALRPYLDTWDRRIDDWGAAARPYDARFFALAGARDGVEQIVPKGPRFTGAVTVLIGPQNSSATFAFARLLRRERLATLVGEPTGGNCRGINGSSFYFLRLPETGLEVDLPLVGTFPLTAEPDAGLVPDRLIAPSRRDFADGRDPVLAALI